MVNSMMNNMAKNMLKTIIKNITNNAMILIFGVVFFIGILLILKSDSWNIGSVESMNLSGTIISVFNGVGLL